MRRSALVALLAAVAVVLASCGSKTASAADIVRKAPDKTAAAGSARVAIDVSFTSSGTPSTITGEGIVDLKNKLGSLTLDLGALGGSLGAGSVQTFLSKDGIFVKLPSNVLPGNKPWLKLNLSTLATQAGINLGSLGQLQSADPSQALTFLKGAVNDMGQVGQEKIRGTDTTHFRGTLDLQQAAATVPDDQKQAVNEAIASLGTSKIPADVWVDKDGRLRRMLFSIDPDGDGPTPPGTIQFEMFDFGVKADLQAPPADQVTDLTNLFGGLPHS